MRRVVGATYGLAGMLVALGTGCAMDVGADPSSEVNVAESALSDDGAIHPGCEGFLGECRDGNQKMCKKYSERCEVRIGVIGDSLSDEYQGAVSALPGVQWTAQVQDDVRITLGAVENNPAVRGEPRNDGFALNWARFGQAALTTQWSSLTDEQLAACGVLGDPRLVTIGSFDAQINGLAAQIAAGQVDVALVWVGHNDLFIRQCAGLGGDDTEFYTALITRIVTAAATLRAYASADPEDIKTKVAIVGLAGEAAALNPQLSAAAAGFGIPFIDPFNEAVNAIVTEQVTTGAFHVGTEALVPFQLVFVPEFDAIPLAADPGTLSIPGTGACGFSPNGYGCSTPDYAKPFQHWDAIHPNTIYMGVIGNRILTDLNSTFGFAMRTIPDAQLLATAGL